MSKSMVAVSICMYTLANAGSGVAIGPVIMWRSEK